VSLFSAIINRQMSLIEWAEQGKQFGLDGVDISLLFVENHSPAYLGKLIRGLKEVGISLIMAATYPDFTHPDPVQREREMEYLRRDIALSSQLAVRYLRVLAGQAYPGTRRAEGVKWAVENLIEADRVARKYGVRLAALGLDPLSILGKVYDRVETIHVSDIAEMGKLQPVLVGTGAVCFPQIFQYLKSRGFDNWLCIEEASFTGSEGIRKAAAYTRKTWDAA